MRHLDEGQVQALLDRELDSGAEREIDDHLRQCPTCASRVEEARRLLREADALIAMLEPPGPHTRLAAELQRQPRLFRDRVERYRRLAWAATIVLAVGLGYYGGSLRRGDGTAVSLPATVQPSPPSAAADRSRVAEPTSAETKVTQTVESPSPPGPERAREPSVPEVKRAQSAEQPVAPSPSRANDQITSLDQRSGPTGAERAFAPPAEPARTTNEGVRPGAPSAGASRDIASARSPATALPGSRRADLLKDAKASEPVSLDEAVAQLDGTIRLIDGMRPLRVLVTAALPDGSGNRHQSSSVRVVYPNGFGREIWLDQERVDARQDIGLLPGDTLFGRALGGVNWVRWLDPPTFLLTLTAQLDEDSLKALVRRVR